MFLSAFWKRLRIQSCRKYLFLVIVVSLLAKLLKYRIKESVSTLWYKWVCGTKEKLDSLNLCEHSSQLEQLFDSDKESSCLPILLLNYLLQQDNLNYAIAHFQRHTVFVSHVVTYAAEMLNLLLSIQN